MPHVVTLGSETQVRSQRLIDDQLWNRLVDRIAGENKSGRPYAERIMEQALGFLLLCAQNPQGRYQPSRTVDIGWHTFLIYTKEYARFCDDVAGRFIHHVPDDDGEGQDDTGTPAAMRAAGIYVDTDLWLTSGECKGQRCYTCST